MAFTGKEGEVITLQEGAEYTLRYRAENPGTTKGVCIGRDHVERILAQGDCKGLRMYFAKETDGSSTLVVVGADSNQDDMLDVIVERLTKCPNVCGGSNPLNSDLKK